MLHLENGPEILDFEQPEEDHGDVLEKMHASGCGSLDQARLTEVSQRNYVEEHSIGTH
jgi:hypothetical protein